MEISLDYLKEQQKIISGNLDATQRKAGMLEQQLVQANATIQQLIGQLNLVNKQIEDAMIEDKAADEYARKGAGKELGGQGASQKSGSQEAVAKAPRAKRPKSDS